MMVEHNFKPYPPTTLNSSCGIRQITRATHMDNNNSQQGKPL